MNDLCLVYHHHQRSCRNYFHQAGEWFPKQYSVAGRQEGPCCSEPPLPYLYLPATAHWLFSPPAGTIAALSMPHCKSLWSPWLSWLRSCQTAFPCHSVKSSILFIKEKFEAIKQKKLKIFYKASIFYWRKSSFTQALLMCLAVCGARVPLLSSSFIWVVR